MSNKHLVSGLGKDKIFGKQGLTVEVRNGNFEGALKVLKKRMQLEGVLKDMRKHEYYEKPGDKKRREKAEARKRWLKLLDERAGKVKKKRNDQQEMQSNF